MFSQSQNECYGAGRVPPTWLQLLTDVCDKSESSQPAASLSPALPAAPSHPVPAGKSGEERLALCLKKANARKEELEKTGAYVEIVRQEPFTIAKDQLDLKVYLLVSRQGMVNQKIQVEEIEL